MTFKLRPEWPDGATVLGMKVGGVLVEGTVGAKVRGPAEMCGAVYIPARRPCGRATGPHYPHKVVMCLVNGSGN